jgi:cobalt/nickel transport system ATP-binding protein
MTIEIKNLSAGYEKGIPVLQNINLTVATGESVAVVGANGAGKSTLLSVLLGFLPYEGHITIQNLELKPENYAAIRAKMGMLFQNPDDQIFQGRIADDIAFGPRNYGIDETEIKKRTQAVLSTLGRLDLLEKYTYKVSFGEKKIAALAGLLVMEPEILLIRRTDFGVRPQSEEAVHRIPWFLETNQARRYSRFGHGLPCVQPRCFNESRTLRRFRHTKGHPHQPGTPYL